MLEERKYFLLDYCWRIDIKAVSQLTSDGQERLQEIEDADPRGLWEKQIVRITNSHPRTPKQASTAL